jgi:hypothetical protein
MPTLEEWRSLPKEVTVKGSSALHCETKIIREYLRVACKGKVDPEGTPTGIRLVKGGRDAVIFAHEGFTSLILPYVDGTDFEAVFSWTKKSHKLAVKWPKGAKPAPVVVGVFEGAASPLDGTAPGDFAKLCTCYKKVNRSSTCDGILGGADADCDRTYGDNCAALVACSEHQPGVYPTCLPGFTHGAIGQCEKQCGPGKEACPAGFVCAADDLGQSVCMMP